MIGQIKLIFWKNFKIRKRYWLLTLMEIIIPIFLIGLLAYGRSSIPTLQKKYIEEPTFYDKKSINEIYSKLDVGKINLWYAPHTPFTKSIVSGVQEKLNIQGEVVRQFDSPNDLKEAFKNSTLESIAVILFNVNNITQLDYDLTISEQYLSWKINKLFRPLSQAEDEEKQSIYFHKGYVSLQAAIDLTYIESLSNETENIKISLQQFPDPPRFVDDMINTLIINYLPLITIFSFLYLCPAVLKRVSEEKCSGTREFMKMLGLKSSFIWLGWLIHALITTLISIIAVTIILKVKFFKVSYSLIEHSDGTVLFVFLFLYCMAAITFCFLVASIFNTPSMATLVGIIIWVMSYFIPQSILQMHEGIPWNKRIFLALMPNIALLEGFSSMSMYEMREIGIQWNNIHLPGSGASDEITILQVFIILSCDVILFMMLTLYIENVKPGPYGIAKSYTFPIHGLKKAIKFIMTLRCLFWHRSTQSEDSLLNVEIGKQPLIQIHNLTKTFNGVKAVNNLNIDINSDCITILLGPNGAGKTTTMNILTGMMNATSGNVKINGKNIREQNNEDRKFVGLCPQHNLLFPDLTVLEHLEFIAKLKKTKTDDTEVENLLKTLEIYDKRDEFPEALSGGMKRKLCLAMTLIGDSKILILDEPTAGMDIESRNKVLNLLLKKRKDAAIFLCTHFIEEAEKIGDRIIIMNDGEVKAEDTIRGLQRKYGKCLVVDLKCNSYKNEINGMVKNEFPGSTFLDSDKKTLNFLLPTKIDEEVLEKFSKQLKSKFEGTISSIRTPEMTLSEIFLKATNFQRKYDIMDTRDPAYLKDYSQVTGNCSTILSLLLKRWYFFRKTYYIAFIAILVATLIFFTAIWVAVGNSECNGGCNNEKSVHLNLAMYRKPTIYINKMPNENPSSLKNTLIHIAQEQQAKIESQVDVEASLLQSGQENIAYYKKQIIIATEFASRGNDVQINAMYSSNALHSVPISFNLITNAIAKNMINTSGITIRNNQLPSRFSKNIAQELSALDVGINWLILFPLSLAFLASSFLLFPNAEIANNFLKIQTFAGVRSLTYWITNIFVDIISTVLQLFIFILILFGVNLVNYEIFTYTDILTVGAIFVMYLIASLPCIYLFGHTKTVTGGFTFLLLLEFVLGIVPAAFIHSLKFLLQKSEVDVVVYEKQMMDVFYVISPPFALSTLCIQFSMKFVENFNWKYMDPKQRSHLCDIEPNPCCNGDDTNDCKQHMDYFRNDDYNMLKIFGMMAISFIFYFIILQCTKIRWKTIFFKLNYKNCKEELCESKNCLFNWVLKVEDLTKKIKKEHILNKLSFNIKRKQCLGLLGKNGAGKSTIFKILTQFNSYDEGKISLRNDRANDVTIDHPQYSQSLGYCPQENFLNFNLTGREIITSMLYVKGYRGSSIDKITSHFISLFDLENYANRPCSEYSGGNKRKLCTCIAFLGCPEIILLDEPTAGVDIISQRKIWDLISDKKSDTSFLLCSHSTEECEKLCDELAIINNGEIQTKGSIKDLRKSFQNGHKIEVKLRDPDKAVTLQKSLEALGAELCKESQHSENVAIYKIQNVDKRLSQIFDDVEKLKQQCDYIDDFSVSPMSLEDVLLTAVDDTKL